MHSLDFILVLVILYLTHVYCCTLGICGAQAFPAQTFFFSVLRWGGIASI